VLLPWIVLVQSKIRTGLNGDENLNEAKFEGTGIRYISYIPWFVEDDAYLSGQMRPPTRSSQDLCPAVASLGPYGKDGISDGGLQSW
jgi:hypothetical protein